MADPQGPDGCRILIVDSDADTRMFYRDVLSRTACSLAEAADGREALVMALTDPPQLVITELRLPFMDGAALCEQLRRDVLTADIPILVITSETRSSEVAHALKAGADTVLIKPADIHALLRESARLLAESIHRAASTRQRVAAQMKRLAKVFAPNVGTPRRAARVTYPRMTKRPPIPPPELACPTCSRALEYRHSHMGGVRARLEQWDYFWCASCGAFEYRHRTRKLQKTS